MSPIAPFLAPERDDPYRKGRPVAGGTTYQTLPGVAGISLGTMNFATNTDSYAPIYLDTPMVLNRASISVTSGSGTSRWGIYRSDVNGQPAGAPVMDSGSIDTSGTGQIHYTPSPAIHLPRGRYLLVWNSSGTPTVRQIQGFCQGDAADMLASGGSSFMITRTVSRAYAAFPTPGTAWDTPTWASTPVRYPISLRFTQG